MVDSKEISQPFTLNGGAEQDLVSGNTKCARSCLQGLGINSLCSTLGIISTGNRCQSMRTFARDPLLPWIDVSGEGTDEAHFVSCTIDTANRIVRNAGEGNSSEASATRRRL